MKEYSIIMKEPTQIVADEFKNSFSSYIKVVKKDIDKENDAFYKEEYSDYLRFIEKKSGINKETEKTYSYYLDNFLKDKSLNKLKSREIEALFNLYKDKMQFESQTISNRDMYKTLDILNETHRNLIRSLDKLKKNLKDKKNWVDIAYNDEVFYTTNLKKENFDERIITNGYKGDNL